MWRSAGTRPSPPPSPSSPTWSASAGWPRTAPAPPTWTCMSPATGTGRRACWPPPRRWHSTDPPPLPATYPPRKQNPEGSFPPLCLGGPGGRPARVAGDGPAGRAPAGPPVPSGEAQHQRRQRDPGDRHRDQQQAPVVGAAHVRRAGQPAQPPDDGGQDNDRQPDGGAVPEDGGPDGREGDGGAGPGQFGPLAGQPRIGFLEIGGRRFPGWRVP